jgi:hypothetical protein
MTTTHRIPVLAAALLAAGCYGSSTSLSGTDTGTAPDAPDAVTDTVIDPGPPPVAYTLHEWGVLVLDHGSAVMHGPSPEASEIMADKPVIYLYADEPFELDLTVGFGSGGTQETWPIRPAGPYVEWAGLRVAPGPCEATPFPTIYENPWLEEYCEACTLGTCVVEDAACVTFEDVVSKILFYNGTLPGFSPALEASYAPDPAVGSVALEVANVSGRAVRDVWFLYRQTGSTCGEPWEYCDVTRAELALAYLGTLEPGSGMGTSLPVTVLEAELDPEGRPVPGTLGSWDEWDALPSELLAALVEHGLTPGEAEAFMSAWHVAMFGILATDSWYVEPMYQNGGALLYFMDRGQYDELLPIETSIPPASMERVGLVYHHL